jgi:phosphodiesterase/alkaline phosphatase D-like protein
MAPAVAQHCSDGSSTSLAAYMDDRHLTDNSANDVQRIIESNSAINEALLSANIHSGAMHVYKPNLNEDERKRLSDAGAIIEEDGIVFVGTPIGKDTFIASYVA